MNEIVLRRALLDAAECLDEAAESIADWGCYASAYFQEKHDLAGSVENARDAAKAFRKLAEVEKPCCGR